MKHYRFLIPILLIILMLYSTYSLVGTNIENKEKYNQYVKSAQEYAKQGIVVDSLECYKQAILMIDSASLRLEVADMLEKNEHMDDAISWMETSLETYPTEPKVYEKLLEEYISTEQFDESYKLINEAEKRKIVTDKIEKLYSGIKYKYRLSNERYEEAQNLGDGYFAVGNNGKKGLLKGVNRILFEQFEYIGGYHDELISISFNGSKYYVDSDGNKRKVPPESIKCDYLGDICDGLISIKENDAYSFYNKEFKKKFGSYEYATNFNEGIAAVKENEKWYLINKEGKKVNNEEYDEIKFNEGNIAFSNGRAFVKKADVYYMVDKNGKQIGNTTYEDAKVFEEKGALAAVKIGGSWTFADSNGKANTEIHFDDAQSFSLGMAAVQKDGLWGYIDQKGNMVIENIFKDVKPFSQEGNTLVSDNEGWMVLSLYKFNN